MTSTLNLRGVRHLMSYGAAGEVSRWQRTGEPISDSAAAAIASWWQSSGHVGRAFAALASGAPVDADDVRHDIAATMPEARAAGPDDVSALDALAAWVDTRDDSDD